MKLNVAGLMVGVSSLALLCAAPAAAQDQPLPPKDYNLDANGVDLATGKVYLSSTDLTIGGQNGGLSYSRTRRALGADDDYTTSLTSNGATIDVAIGSERDTFAASGGNSTAGTGAQLTIDGVAYIYMRADGTRFRFTTAAANQRIWYAPYRVDTITGADGKVLTIGYQIQLVTEQTPGACDEPYDPNVLPTVPNCDPTQHVTQYQISRPSTVVSNDGYRLDISYQSNTADPADLYHWFQVSAVVGSNLAQSNGNWPVNTYSVGPGYETHTDPMSRQTVTTTDGANRITGVQLPGDNSPSITYAYDGAGRVSSVTRAGGTWSYSYVDNGGERTTTVTSPTGLQQVAVSLPSGKMKSVKTGTAQPDVNAYDGEGRIVSVTRPEGNKTVFGYDVNDNVVTQTAIAKDSTARTVTSTFDCSVAINCHKPTSVTDALLRVTNYEYSPVHGGVTVIRAPAPAPGQPGPEKRFEYQQLFAWYHGPSGFAQATTPIWKVTAISECSTGAAPACVGTAAETRTEITYGSPGTPNNLLPTQVTVRAGDNSVSTTNSFTYDAVGNLASVTDARGHTSNAYYNAARQVTGVVGPDPDGAGPLERPATDIAYGPDGQVGTTTEGRVNAQSSFTAHRQIQITYDAYHRKVRETVVAGSNIYSVTDNNYDADGRAKCVAVRMNTAFWLSHSNACAPDVSNPASQDRVSQTFYDTAGRVVRQESAVGTADASEEVRIAYTANGLPEHLTDAMNNRTTNEYDPSDRLVVRYYPAAGQGSHSSNGNDREEFGYDAGDRLTTNRRRDGRYVYYDYDNLDRLTTRSLAQGCAPFQVGACPPASATRPVHYGYDLLGRLQYARFDSAAGEGVEATWNALGRITSTTSTMGGVSRTLAHQYDAAGNRTRITHPDSVRFDYSYDQLGRMENAWWWTPANGTTPFLDITYDQHGRRADLNRASSFTGYAYDPASRLDGMNQRFAGDAGNLSVGMVRNPAGQIIQRTTSSDDYTFNHHYTVDRPYATNGLNQYTSAGPATFAYDRNGNLISDGTTTFAYDGENRLTSSSNGAALQYDPLGRLWRTSGGTNGVTDFLYDGDHVVAEYDGATGSMRRRYMWGPGADEPIMVDEGSALNCSGTRFYHPDERGSIVALANCWGDRTKVNAYDEHGVPAPTNAPVEAGGRFGYTGQMWVPELGLWYYKARMYSPTLGRFMQTDPIGYADGMNWYNYVKSDPVNLFDPTGLGCQIGENNEDISEADCKARNGTYVPDVVVTARRLNDSDFADLVIDRIRDIVSSISLENLLDQAKDAYCSLPAVGTSGSAGGYHGLGGGATVEVGFDPKSGRLSLSAGPNVGVGVGASIDGAVGVSMMRNIPDGWSGSVGANANVRLVGFGGGASGTLIDSKGAHWPPLFNGFTFGPRPGVGVTANTNLTVRGGFGGQVAPPC